MEGNGVSQMAVAAPAIEVVDDGMEEIKLEEKDMLKILLLRERVTSAQTLADLRKTESDVVLASVLSQFAENNTYEIKKFDMDKGIVYRVKRMA